MIDLSLVPNGRKRAIIHAENIDQPYDHGIKSADGLLTGKRAVLIMPRHVYWVDRDTGKKCRLNGYRPSTRPPENENLRRDFTTEMMYKSEEDLPKGGVDLRDSMPPVQCQSAIASCTANALATSYAYLLREGNESDEDVSRLFIYYNARLKNKGTKMSNSGVSMTFAIEALAEYGACPDEVWPYDVKKVNDVPPDEAYEEAKNNKIREAFIIDPTLLEMKGCLAQGFPFAFGLTLYVSFDQAKEKGVVPMPKLHEATRKSHPSHAMLAVGYIESKRVFIVRNSWSDTWGDKGYCYIPYDYMTDKVRCYDLWSIRRLESNDLGRKHWKEDPNWCPCSFSYFEEYQRVEQYNYEENIFQEFFEDGNDEDELGSSDQIDDDVYPIELYPYQEAPYFDQQEPLDGQQTAPQFWEQSDDFESEELYGRGWEEQCEAAQEEQLQQWQE